MLTLTENANTIAATIVAQESTQPDAGLRIQTSGNASPSEPRFSIAIAPQPEPGDEVIGDEQLRVFLEQAASEALADKVLDAAVDEQGGVSFTLLPQPA